MDESKERVVFQAALDEFRDKGVHGARMQAIADRAGVNKALVHYYFRSKDQIYMRVLEEITVPFWHALNEKFGTLDADDYEGAVRTIAVHVIESAIALPHSTILLSEFASGGAYVKQMEHLLEKTRVESAPVLSFFFGLVERGVVKRYNPLNIFVNILGMCWNVFLAEPFSSPVLEQMGIVRDDAFYREYIDLIVDMASGLKRA
jgi:TetR/AcrR family transcriptional regulator